MSQSKAVLRPMEQSSAWTFDLALALLRSPPEPSVSDALDEFLLHNKDVLLLPMPFLSKALPLPAKKEFTLRGILYMDVTSEDKAMAEKLAPALGADVLETLRVIVQTKARVPQFAISPKSSLPSRLPNEEASNAEQERTILYASALLLERQTVLRIAAECFDVCFDETRSSVVRNIGKTFVAEPNYALAAVTALDKLADELVKGKPSDSVGALAFVAKALHAAKLLKFLHDIFLTSTIVAKPVVSAWFAFMAKSRFLHILGPHIENKESFTLLHALCTVVTLQVLDLEHNYGDLRLYLEDSEVFSTVNSAIMTHPSNSIIKYAWLITLYRACVAAEDSDSALVSVKDTQKDIAKLQTGLQHSPVFSEIIELNKFLKFDSMFAVTLSTLIMAALPVVTVNPDIAKCIAEVVGSAPNSTIEKFFDNVGAQDAIILARAKFPVAISPYLRLASINGSFALKEFEELKSYMSLFDKAEFGMLYDIDLENTDLIKLTKMVDVYPPYEVNKKLSMVLNFDTKGKIIPTEDPAKILVAFLYNYNGWAFLGRVLQNISKTFDISQEEKMMVLEDILDLMIRTFEQNPTSDIPAVLDYTSAYVDDSDVIEIIFRLLEQALHNRSVLFLGKILQLLSSLMPVVSARIWPYLATSSLLPNMGKEGFLSILFGSIEMVSGDYAFSTALAKFVFSLAENCLPSSQDYPEESKSQILARFIDHLILVFESYSTCKFNDTFQKLHLGVLILDAFRQILETVFMVDPNVVPQKKPTKVFAEAASRILNSFLFTESHYTRSASPIFQMIDSVAASIVLYDAIDISGYIGDVWIHTALSFSRLLITIRSSTKEKPSHFEKEFFSKLSQLVTIYSRGGSHRKAVLDLISALTSGVWETEQMPSMLSHLGRDSSRVFLHSLSTDLSNPFDDYAIKISIYDLLCSMMEANQQGLSILFISGRDVFGEFSKIKDTDEVEPLSLLYIMKKNVSNIVYYPSSVTVHLLDALSLAFNSWTTARNDESDGVFVGELVSMLDHFSKPSETKGTYDLVLASYHCKVHAKIAEILSLILFTTKNDQCRQKILGLLTSQKFIDKIPDLLSISNYQISLYDHVHSQFEHTFPKYKLAEFGVAIQKRNRFGFGAVYDLLLMDQFFQANPMWKDIRKQVIYASTNIHNYNSQVALSRSVGALLTTLCRSGTKVIPAGYLNLVPKLLKLREPKDTYTENYNSQQYFERIELSFLLAYTINGIDSVKKDTSCSIDIIEACGELMTFSDVGYILPQFGKDGRSYRSLLRLVYIALSGLTHDYDQVIARLSVLEKFFDFAIARGTKSIIIELQNDVYLSRTNKKHVSGNFESKLDDLRLILSILKCFVSLQISPTLHEEMLRSLESNGTVESVLSLYSFSHLILVNEEPIFAQLSLMFMQQLLTVDAFADKFVNSNMFMVIRESVISQPLRNGGITLQNAPQLHRTWTNGILPILVTCLARSGKVNEVAVALWAFSKQIKTCIESWSKDSSSLQVSSAATLETMQILFMSQILSAVCRDEGLTGPGSEVDLPMLPGIELPQKREEFVNYLDNLLKHPNFLASRIVPSNPEEAAMIKSEGEAYGTFVKNLIEEISELKEFFR